MCAAIQVGCYFNGVVGAMLDLAYAIRGCLCQLDHAGYLQEPQNPPEKG
jgi:hypothetical protein